VLSPAKSLRLDADLTAEFTAMLADLRKSNTGTLEKARSAMLPRQLISLRVPMRTGKVEGGAGAGSKAAGSTPLPTALASRVGTALDYALFMDNPLDKNDTRPIEAIQDFWFRPGKPMVGDARRRGGPPRGPQGRPLAASAQQGRR